MEQTFVFLSADAHDQRFLSIANDIVKNRDATGPEDKKPAIRRPYRGIQIKDDTYATLSIYKANGDPIKLWSESAFESDGTGHGKVVQYGDFILQRISDERSEKQQVVETFGDSFIFFFGERPRIVSFTGMLVDSDDFNWRGQFWKNYNEHLRGTKLVEQNARAYLSYGSIVIEGYPIQAAASEDSANPNIIQFQMSMFVTNYTDFSDIGSRMFPGDRTVPDVEAINRDLENGVGPEGDYQGLTAAGIVRLKNFMSSRGKTVSSVLREMTRVATNNKATDLVSSFLGSIFSDVQLLLNGRAMTVEGTAGFLDQIGSAAVAPGSVSSLLRAEPGAGSIRVLVPGVPRFGTVPDDLFRTYKSKNIDEYPYLSSKELNIQVDPFRASIARLRAVDRQRIREENDLMSVVINMQELATASALNTVASIAQFAKETAKATHFMFVMSKTFDNPATLLTAAFGLGELAPGQTSAGNPDLFVE